jgi:hypothetical protein
LSHTRNRKNSEILNSAELNELSAGLADNLIKFSEIISCTVHIHGFPPQIIDRPPEHAIIHVFYLQIIFQTDLHRQITEENLKSEYLVDSRSGARAGPNYHPVLLISGLSRSDSSSAQAIFGAATLELWLHGRKLEDKWRSTGFWCVLAH